MPEAEFSSAEEFNYQGDLKGPATSEIDTLSLRDELPSALITKLEEQLAALA